MIANKRLNTLNKASSSDVRKLWAIYGFSV